MDAVVKMNQAVAIGNLDGVLPLESRVLNSNLQRHPTAAVAVFRSMRARGDVRRAVNVLENVDRRTGSPLSIYTTLAKEYLNQGNLNGTARLVTEGERWFEQTAFLPIRLQVAFWRQSPRHISKYRQECEISIGQIKNACREIVNYQAELRGEPKPYSSPFEKIRGYFPSS